MKLLEIGLSRAGKSHRGMDNKLVGLLAEPIRRLLRMENQESASLPSNRYRRETALGQPAASYHDTLW